MQPETVPASPLLKPFPLLDCPDSGIVLRASEIPKLLSSRDHRIDHPFRLPPFLDLTPLPLSIGSGSRRRIEQSASD
jgi:hypothetical protein